MNSLSLIHSSQKEGDLNSAVLNSKHETTFEFFSSEVLMLILSFLPSKDLVPCSAVNRQWREITEHIYSVKVKKEIGEDFTPLVKNGLLTWKLVDRVYKPLPDFFNSCLQESRSTTSWIKQENSKLSQIGYDNILTDCILQPYLKYRGYSFSISNFLNIKVQHEGNETTIETKNDDAFIYLIAEGDYLFALDLAGFVTQWNYKTGELIQRIKTAYAEQNQNLSSLFGGFFCQLGSFVAKDGMLVLKYGTKLRSTCIVEIIPYASRAPSKLMIDDHLKELDRVLVEDGTIFLVGQSGVWSYDPLTMKKEFINHTIDAIQDVVLDKNKMYILKQTFDFCEIDLKRKTFSSYSTQRYFEDKISKIQVIHNVLLVFIKEKKQVTALDVSPKQSQSFTITLKLDNQYQDIENLFNLVQRYLSPQNEVVKKEKRCRIS